MRKLGLLLLFVMPLLPLAISTHLYQLPAQVKADVVDLRGAWKIREVTGAQLEGISIDDNDWATVHLPGMYFQQGFTGSESWLRRTFDLTPGLHDQDAVLMLGAVRGGIARVFVNGHKVGEIGFFAESRKLSLTESSQFLVPKELLRDTGNAIALDVKWLGAPENGLMDRFSGLAEQRLYVGPAEGLRERLLTSHATDDFVRFGAVLLLLFAIALGGAMVASGAAQGSQHLHFTMAGLALATISFQLGTSGLASMISANTRTELIYFDAVVGAFFVLEFSEGYLLGRVTRVRKAHRIITSTFAVAGVLVLLIRPKGGAPLYDLFSSYWFFVLLYVGFLAARDAVRTRLPLRFTFAAAVLATVFAWVNDIAVLVGGASSPLLFDSASLTLSICASVLLMTDFINLSAVNQRLTQSLTSTNALLHQALTQAQDATRVKGEIMARISHELRTPLNAILNIPDGLVEQFEPTTVYSCATCGLQGQQRLCPTCGAQCQPKEELHYTGHAEGTVRHLQSITRNAHQLLGLVEQVLDASKLEAGSVTLQTEDVRMDTVLEGVLSALEPVAAKKRIQLTWAGSDLAFRTDAARLSQVVSCFVDNAIKFSPEGTLVQVEANRVDRETIQILVRDEGIGIAPEHHALIFESFRQVDGGSTRRFGGAGLGLANAKKLVDLLGGSIVVEGALGKGSTFRVLLPARTSPDEARAQL